ncbi:hypothetical protein V5O48_010289 [Marasmius crinis-equi]|uniref:Uncharacterized protein n=1 Tax=Marasmius crinis-equi TaxID=585013 RepID=A0ABR3F8V2_9AGAR
MGAYPCPFSVFLLGIAFDVNLQDDAYASGAGFRSSVLGAHMSPGYGDNNSGITVFDVTDPTNPSYCHCASLHRLTPITAAKYAGKFEHYADIYPAHLTEGLGAFFDVVKLIPHAALAEAWPDDFRPYPKTSSRKTSSRDHEDQPPQSDAVPMPSLSDLALKPAIEQAIADGNIEPLEHFAWSPEKAALITSILRARSGNPLEPVAVTLLSKVIEANPVAIDLSDFMITSDQVVEVLAGLNSDQAIHYLNLSHNTNITSSTLHSVLVAHPLIHRLVLYGTSIADEDIDTLLHENRSLFHHVGQLIHPSVFSFTRRKTFTPAFSFYASLGGMALDNALSLPMLNPTMILHALSDLFKAWIRPLELKATTGGDLGMSHSASLAIFSAAPQEAGRKWSQRAVVCCPLPAKNIFSKGWLFMFNMSTMSLTDPSYGFLRPKRPGDEEAASQRDDDPDHEIHDFDSFITELKREGYPEPPAGLVEEVEKLLRRLKEKFSSRPEMSAGTNDGGNEMQNYSPMAALYRHIGSPKLVTKEQVSSSKERRLLYTSLGV